MELAIRHLRSVLAVEGIFSAFVESYGSDFNFPGESHEVWEIGAVLSGCAGITSGAEIYECGVGELIIHPPGAFHTAWAKDQLGVRILTVTFTAHGSRYVPSGKFVLTAREQTVIHLLGELIDHEVDTPFSIDASLRPEAEQMIKNYIEILCLSLHLRRAETESPAQEEKAALFAEIVGFMQAHVDDALTVEDICVACGIGRTTLKELFRRFTGTGAIKYYNHLRVRRAIALMDEGESMQQIATRMHFSSQNYFSDFFRRATGVPPTKYFK
ncbi:MAG: helix-turn-helix transcriptional regulator [Clostridia bacterium]|nr:helix-turn-helix transcriptional regulator [Clostridia bacterium]